MKAFNKFKDIFILVWMVGIQNGIGQHRQPMPNTGFFFRFAGILDRPGMQTDKQRTQTGIFLHGKIFNPRVFQYFDSNPLKRTEVIRNNRGGPAAVRSNVRQQGAIAVNTFNIMLIVIHIRHPNTVGIVIGHGFAQFIEARRIGHKMFRVLPQTTQVQIKFAFIIDEQGAVAFTLQNGAAIRRLQAEIILLPFGMVAVVTHTVLNPVFQAFQRKLVEQIWNLIQQLRQTGAGDGGMKTVNGTRGALHHVQ